jgi:hypothetical protein
MTNQPLIIVREQALLLVEERVRNALTLQDCFDTGTQGEQADIMGTNRVGTFAWCLESLNSLAQGYKCWCVLMTDFAPFSFFWSLQDLEGHSPLHGGLIFHKNSNWKELGNLGSWSLHT